jgi:hypothetical protein
MIAARWCFATSLILMMQASTVRAASIVTEWLDQALPYAQEVAWEPTVGARFFATLHTAMYDAWTAYDPVALGVVSGMTLKGRGGANNAANKREAISHAAFTVLQALAPQHRHALVEWMQELGYDPNADTRPAEVGRRAAVAVLANCRDDGANEAGNFADTTGYEPRTSGRLAADRVAGEASASNDPAMDPRHALLAGARMNSAPFRRRSRELSNGRGKLTS